MIIKKQWETNYTNVTNSIFSENGLSFPAMGLLCYLLSKPIDWAVLPKHCAKVIPKKENSKASYKYVLELIQELVNHGYITKKKTHSGGMDYTVYDTPISDFPYLLKTEIGKNGNSEKPNVENVDTNKEKNSDKGKNSKERKDNSSDFASENLNDISLFDNFWKLYPRKQDKQDAKKKFNKLSKERQFQVIKATKIFVIEMKEKDPEYILLPTTFLNKRRYEDDTYNLKKNEPNEGGGFSEVKILTQKVLMAIEAYDRADNLKKQKEMLVKDYSEYKTNEGEDYFNVSELDVLKELGSNLEDFKEIEFQKGEIQRTLGGLYC